MTTILIKKRDTTGAPATADLTNAAGGTEIAVNTYDKRIYTKTASSAIVELGTNPSSITITNVNGGAPANGELLIGNGSGMTRATLTAGSGVTVTNGTGSITIAASASTGDITFSSNVISTANTNENMVLKPNGVGTVFVNTTSTYFGGNSTPLEVVGDTSARVYPAIFVIRSEPRSVIVWNNTSVGDAGLMVFGTDPTYTFRGNIAYNRSSGLVAYNTSSDYRAKDVYGPVTDSGAKIDAIKIYRGKMHGATVERPMAIAHELAEPAPYAVSGQKDALDENGNPLYQQVDYTTLVPLLIAEIQSLRARVAALESK